MEKIKVLVVDDEEDFRDTLVNRFKKRGFEAFGAESGEKALESINTYLYDVVILDIKMPGMDGITALREIKKIRPLIEVIMLTGHGTVESGIEGMKLGAFDYLSKPSNIDAIIEKINQAYEKKEAHEDKIRQATIRDLSAHPLHVKEIIKKEKKK